ncbi:SDR family NAD(P)-dependent oxidoreductase [Streptomyces sp. NPDC006529]|uniref:SDR family NAD(P)-dependent oxidoreductase n=1 Tax=Streptomyces sp. NPDC006529 TaxID=3157177 RepID=UPI0033BE373B
MTPQAAPPAAPRDLVVALSPFEEPNARLVTAAERAGALGLLDLGRDPAAARSAFTELCRRLGRPYGVRVPRGCPLGPADLPAEVDTVLLADPAGTPGAWAAGGRRLWAEVTTHAEAVAALAAGAAALVARGHESGGRVGDSTTFVLVQRLLADPGITVPVLACGGLGPHTAAAAVAGGAAGVVLDGQLALTTEGEAALPAEVADALRTMDAGQTRIADGHRVYARPGLATPEGPVAPLLGARSLSRQLLPVGQDGPFAARLAARHRTTGGVLQAVRAAVLERPALVARCAPLRPRQGGSRLPVAQGPMTRVSDQAAFAEAVAAGGAVPYLALAVMAGADVRRLLTETAERLAGRPWGVGLLGFAPPELRREQLAAVADVRPPYAIVAGGSPAQAAPLEAAGTVTHLHVPSPALLERYLAEGARRFVFEGLECGGHVGPRASFPLWEEQLELLLADGEPASLDVLFAGGIHDARSAAMAAAAAAPLVERGARFGVLMGTAYLFTEEAVAAGAVLPGFQRAALECADTVLLHTAPGHATRCAPTPYAETFVSTRRRLEREGTDQRQVWEELERLNLGRLRIASKGLGHRSGAGAPGAAAEAVDEEQQRAEGLFMLGQAATLRAETTTVAALHHEVTHGASELLERRARQFARAAVPAVAAGPADPLDVAIVGMACAYPGAPDLAAFWAQILAGTDAVSEVPAERWDPELYYDADPARAGERTPSRWGGFLAPLPFDALAHGIAPASLSGIEPVQLLALEISARALADAGYGAGRDFDRSRTSVVFGAEAGTELAGAYGLRALHPAYLGPLPPELDEQLPRLTEDSFPGILANVIAGRVANRLDLGGANCTVDAACASSLAALDLACRQLRDGDSDMVLCGGADVHNGINDYLMFASVRALSPGGRCRPFDADADGIALGEGVGALVLKRLSDAERDGDRVYAVIKAVGASSDGRSLGLTAPRPEGQRRALERAYARAGIAPAAVGLVEAHGTGTVVGDSTELTVLSEVFTEAGARPGGCTLGSVKSQIGHTKCAAGLAGLIKAAWAVHTGVRPPTAHLAAPNAAWPGPQSPFRFDTEARPWPVPVERRIAGVSAFGFGGTNYHAVLAGYAGAAEPRHSVAAWPVELFCFRGADRRAAGRAMARLAARLEENEGAGRPWALRDLAAETARGTAPVLVAVLASGPRELAERLERARTFTAGEGVYVRPQAPDPGRVAFLFPGQGSQRPGMLGDLFVAFPALRRLLDRAPGAVTSAMFPPTAFTGPERAGLRDAVTDTRIAQPALGLAGAAAHLLLAEVGVRPDAVAGHSYGELTALWAAGAYDTQALLRLSARRAEAILGAAGTDPGAMAAVAGTPQEVRAVAERAGCVVANHNAPRQCVVSGPTAAVDAAVRDLRAAGLTAQPLAVACAFHSPVVAGAADDLADALAEVEVTDPAVPVWSNSTARPYPAGADAVRELLAGQVARPVRFVEQIEAMYAAGVRTFVEAGPGRVLSGLVEKILGPERPCTVVPLDVPGGHGVVRLVTALAELVAAGVPVAPEALFRGRTSVLPERAPRRAGWLVDGHLVRTADGAPVAGGLRPPRRITAPPAASPSASTALSVEAPGAREAAVLAYLDGTRELIAAQRDVVLGYLGASPGALAEPRPVVPAGGVEALPEVTAAEAPLAPVAVTAAGVMEVVLDIVHRRTGYPLDMLDPELDLEADLSVDSIKRVEIIGALADRIGLPRTADGSAESAVEELARIKTLRGIVEWITSHRDAGGTGPGPASDTDADTDAGTREGGVAGADRAAEPPGAAGGPGPARPGDEVGPTRDGFTAPGPDGGAGPAGTAPRGPGRVRRMTLSVVPAGETRTPGDDLRGQRIGVAGDGQGVALALTALLRADGAEVCDLGDRPDVVDGPDDLGALDGLDGLVDLGALRGGPEPALPGTFPGLRRALTGGIRRLLLVSGAGGRFGHRPADGAPDSGSADPTAGAGLHGFARSAALEYPGVLLRAVDIDPKERADRIAARLMAELRSPGGPVSVGYGSDGARVCLRAVAAPLPAGAAATGPLPLGPDSVVLLTGGARGITARAALALAEATGCHVELVGRTPEPAAEPDAFAQAHDRVALRAALIAGGLRKPAEIEAAASRVLAEREVRATLRSLGGAAASVRYHRADVTDEDAVRAVVADVRARHGRLDGIVHGAGTLRDALVADKEPAAFTEVFTTKVAGARHLAAAAAEHGRGPAPSFLVLFASVAGVFGNRGQCDYAAANDALDGFAHTWSDTFPGRVLAIDWGPWAAASGGMVTPELERNYARRGIRLIGPEEGAAAFLAELALLTAPDEPNGPGGADGPAPGGRTAQVVLMADEDPSEADGRG